MSAESFSKLEDLNQWLAERHMAGFWNSPRVSEEVKPYLWKWTDIARGLAGAAELVPMEMVAMRTIQPQNPGLGVGMTKTLHFSIQTLRPGERTKAHRNLVTESRFVVKASPGAVFIVDGEAFPMEEGDLITTPNWSWHDHYNGGSEPVIWLDGMDTRLVGTLVKGLNERFPGDHQPIERVAGYSARTLGHAQARWMKDQPPTPPFQYKWCETYETLRALRETEMEADPFDGIHLTYAHPLTGGPTFPTYACEVQLLPPRLTTKTHRHNHTTIYHAFRGAGVTEVDGQRFEWSQGDIFVVPPWAWHHHENGSEAEAILYSITDRPAVAALGLDGEEAEEP